MSARFACFVTGTDTEVGKTLVSCAMLQALAQADIRATGMKPIAAGTILREGVWHNEDVDALAAASCLRFSQDLTTPYLLHTAAAPHVAAIIDEKSIELAKINECYRQLVALSDAVVVEGVGGFRVPLASGYDTADMAVQFALPVVLVVGLRLGCLNHALLTAEAIAARGLALAGWVANTVDPDMPFLSDNVAALKELLPAPLLGVVPRMPESSAALAASYLDFSGLPDWPGKPI